MLCSGLNNNKKYQWIASFPTDTLLLKKIYLEIFFKKYNEKESELFFIKTDKKRHNIFGLWSIDLVDQLEKIC